ncbi:YceD family protein [Sphingomonas sp. Root241]|uniref:YceD family protein n=1 Tax=Sphingomonas sp. Root241 TaxID=1736501 RepID=UPI00070013D7|nr:YceD family protein [Sphingomonas sp. Root241]KRC79921.1 hypothetical protein ASE13_12750 [Sphingomonas sp. Root241]
MTPEFPRPHRLDQIGAGETNVTVEANETERAALARRFDLVALDRLAASFALRRDAAGVRASGHLSAAVTQSCGVTGDPLPAKIEEDFAIRFLTEPTEDESHDEIELAEEDLDTVFYTGSALDLGEAAAETLALALDPFPRSPNAAEVLKQAGVISEEEAGPFGALAALKDKLGKK